MLHHYSASVLVDRHVEYVPLTHMDSGTCKFEVIFVFGFILRLSIIHFYIWLHSKAVKFVNLHVLYDRMDPRDRTDEGFFADFTAI